MKSHQLALTCSLAFALAACGGDGTVSVPVSGPTLKGTAATGLAIPNAKVDAKCGGASGSATTAADGTYELKMASGSLPCVLQVTNPSDGKKLHSIAVVGGTVNVTPFTEMLTVRLMRADMATVFAQGNTAAVRQAATADSLQTAHNDVKLLLNGIVDISTISNLLATPLKAATASNTAGGDAQDKLLDALKVKMTSAQFAQALTVLAKAGPVGQPLPNPDAAFVPTLAVQPLAVTLAPGATTTFGATTNYPPNVYYIRQPVKWQVVESNGGTVTMYGVYKAPQTAGTYHVKVQREDFPTLSATATVTVSATAALQPPVSGFAASAVFAGTEAYSFDAAIDPRTLTEVPGKRFPVYSAAGLARTYTIANAQQLDAFNQNLAADERISLDDLGSYTYFLLKAPSCPDYLEYAGSDYDAGKLTITVDHFSAINTLCAAVVMDSFHVFKAMK